MVATQYFKMNFSVELMGDLKIVLALFHEYWLKKLTEKSTKNMQTYLW